jgi:rfaE bifunctional protein kinase chain/domain/rfaE bifunctional protein nucleotidyltransferase chain/domain
MSSRPGSPERAGVRPGPGASWPQEPTLTPELPYALARRGLVVTVVGDLMLDGWWLGRSERMTREAPAPVVEVTERRYAPGGAGNTAMNLAALGAHVRMVGVAGDDEAGHLLAELLAAAGVDVGGLLLSPAAQTVTKNRVLSGDQILLRIDDVPAAPYADELRQQLAERVPAALAAADVLLVCDYGSGALAGPVTERLAAAERPPLTVVDAHQVAAWSSVRPDLVTPNAAEAFAALGRATPRSDRAGVLAAAATELRARTGAAELVVTLDRDGTLVLPAAGSYARTQAQPSTERQASGAGDTFVAALALARAAGLELAIAAEVAQAAADVVVQRFGTSVCTTEDLAARLAARATAELQAEVVATDGVLDQETLLRRVAQERAAGRRIVVTNGCFDVLHRGHVSYLGQAAQLGDVLVVAVNSDDSVRRLKGPDRPINSTADRAGVLAALSCVDYVTVFDTDTPIPLLERLRPDVYTKGGDYSPDMLEETEVVRRHGGEVQIMGYVSSVSTSAVLQRIRTGAELG